MIRVNLLPQEYRKAEATPLKQFFATIGAVVVAAVAWAVAGYVHYGVLGPARQDLETLKEEVKGQEPQVKLSKNLEGWLGEYRTQFEKIDKVAESRVVASRKLDEIWEIVVSPKVPGRYEVWLKNLAWKTNPGGAKSGGDIVFACVSAGTQIARLSDFHEDLKTSDFFKEFDDITYPYGNREDLGVGREPKEGWSFNFTLNLRPLKDLYEARTKPAQGKK
jgi:Tfp pilus assembly protein PilN